MLAINIFINIRRTKFWRGCLHQSDFTAIIMAPNRPEEEQSDVIEKSEYTK